MALGDPPVEGIGMTTDEGDDPLAVTCLGFVGRGVPLESREERTAPRGHVRHAGKCK